MKVFYRVKKTPEGDIIPFNYNISQSLDGALQCGLLTRSYFRVDEIYDEYELGDIVLDGIDQVQYCLNKFGIEPQDFNYPEVLQPYLGRKIWKITNIYNYLMVYVVNLLMMVFVNMQMHV